MKKDRVTMEPEEEKFENGVEFPMSFYKYLEIHQPGFDKYKKAYIGAIVQGEIKTKSEWDAVIAKNL